MMDAWISNGPVKCSSDGIWCHKEMMEMIDEPLTKQKTSDLCTTPTPASDKIISWSSVTWQIYTVCHQDKDSRAKKVIQKVFCIAHCLFRKILFASCLRSMTKNIHFCCVENDFMCGLGLKKEKPNPKLLSRLRHAP